MLGNNTSGDPGVAQFPPDLQRWAEIIKACEALCLLSGRTLVDSVHNLPDGPRGFLESISEHSLVVLKNQYDPTTTAQCIAALQALVPIVRRFRKPAPEGTGRPFHSVPVGDSTAVDPEALHGDMNKVIDCVSPTLLQGDFGASIPASLQSDAFANLHPFTCSNVLRAISPTSLGRDPVWWRSLFVVLWYLNYSATQRGTRGGTLSQDCPATAFLMSRSIDSIECCIEIWKRRQERIDRLATLVTSLADAEDENSLKWTITGAAYKDTDNTLPRYRRSYITHLQTLYRADLFDTFDEFSWDSAVHSVFEKLREGIATSGGKDNAASDESHSHAKPSGKPLDSSFPKHSQSIKEEIASQFHSKAFASSAAALAQQQDEATQIARNTVTAVSELHQLVSPGNHGQASAVERHMLPHMDHLPSWVLNPYYKDPTTKHYGERFAKLSKQDQSILQHYWHAHVDAVNEAWDVLEVCQRFIASVYRIYNGIGENGGTDLPGDLKRAARELDSLTQQLKSSIRPAISWCEFVLHQHLAYARAGFLAHFDPCELAHAVRTVCRYGDTHDFETIVAAIDVICDSQRTNGTWPSTQPFHWVNSGAGLYALSIETAWALTSAMKTITQHASHFGVSEEIISARLAPAYDCLERVFQWASGNLHSFPTPFAMRNNGASSERVYGWCSDRVPEPAIIHNWATAVTIEFLIDYRELLQHRINFSLRHAFVSYHPAALHPMHKVAPTDLDVSPIDARVTSKVKTLVRHHRLLSIVETSGFFPTLPSEVKPDAYSLILYGPPGTSKTFLAKAIAGELKWPLVMLSPSDFLAGGEPTVEARAREIFQALNRGSRLVYFFDEIDELLLDRNEQQETRRSVFSFLTPSFLTKFQDLRDAAKEQEFIFLIGTNYVDRIDQAARRKGRIDDKLLLIYPDTASRANIVMNHLFGWMNDTYGKLCDNDAAKDRALSLASALRQFAPLEKVTAETALLSLPCLHQVCQEIWKAVHNHVETSRSAADGRREHEEREQSLASWLKSLFERLSTNDHETYQREFSFDDYVKRKGSDHELAALLRLLPSKEAAEKQIADLLAKGEPDGQDAAFKARMERVRAMVGKGNTWGRRASKGTDRRVAQRSGPRTTPRRR